MRKGLSRVALAAVFVATAAGLGLAATPVGTVISATSTCAFKTSSGAIQTPATSNAAQVSVARLCAVSASVDATSRAVAPGETAVFTVTAANQGNGADTMTVSARTQTAGWLVGVFTDSNGNGVLDEGEAKASHETPEVAPGTSTRLAVAARYTGQVASSACTLAVTVMCTAVPTTSKTLTLTASAQGGGNVRNWALLGCYTNPDPNRLGTDYLGGEPNACPGVNVDEGEWKTFSAPSGVVDLSALYGGPANGVAYAGLYVNCPTARQISLVYTTTGGSKVLFNGAVVFTQATPPADPNTRRLVTLQAFAGWNRLVIKLAQGSGAWRFAGSVSDPAGLSAAGLTTSAVRQEPQTLAFLNTRVSSVDMSSATVTWETDVPTSTILDLWTEPENPLRYEAPALVTRHTVRITALERTTHYEFEAAGRDAFGYEASGQSGNFDTTSTPSRWISSWIVAGPYGTGVAPALNNDFLAGEASVWPSEGGYARGPRWQLAQCDAEGVLDFAACYPGMSYRVAYAMVYVYSPSDQYVYLFTGSDDGIKIIANGQAVLTKDIRRTFVPDQDRTQILLRRGWNRVMVKVSQYTGTWRMCARIATSGGTPYTNLQYGISCP